MLGNESSNGSMNESLSPPSADVSELNVSDIGLPSDIMSSDSFLMRSGMAAIICSASVNTLASVSPLFYSVREDEN